MNRFRTVFDHTLISLCNSTTARLLPKLWGVSPAMLQSSQSALVGPFARRVLVTRRPQSPAIPPLPGSTPFSAYRNK